MESSHRDIDIKSLSNSNSDLEGNPIRQGIDASCIESLIAEIRRLIQPAINSDSKNQTPLQKSTETLLKYIEENIYKAYTFTNEGIHAEKDLAILQLLILQPELLENIESLYQRSVHNTYASGRFKKAGIASTVVGGMGFLGAAALTLFPPTALIGIATYTAIGSAALGSTAGSTGAGLIASNKREILAALEKSVVDAVLEEFKSKENYSSFAKAGLKIIKIKLTASKNLTDNDLVALDTAINDIKDEFSKEEITNILNGVTINYPDEITELSTLLNKKSPEDEPNHPYEGYKKISLTNK